MTWLCKSLKKYFAQFPWAQFFKVLGLPLHYPTLIVPGDIMDGFHQKYFNEVAGNNLFLGSRPYLVSVLFWLTLKNWAEGNKAKYFSIFKRAWSYSKWFL